MLAELRVENVGVIAELGLVLGPGMTVVTGETGAGKTLVVEAIELLLGARADTGLVRAGTSEARVEARFELPVSEGGGELVLARVVPADGRSRAYLNGRLVPAAELAEVGRPLVDLHGQHSHHALLTPAAQRAALDRFARTGAELEAYRAAREWLAVAEAELAGLGGDERARAREVDLLRFQVEEIDAAALDGPDEDERLAAEEEFLASVRAVREAAQAAYDAVEGAGLDALGSAAGALAGAAPLEALAVRLRALQDEAADAARELRRLAEGAEEDPARLEAVGARRRLLHDLRRKYGETLADVLAFRDDAAARLEGLLGATARADALEREREAARRAAIEAASELSGARRRAAPGLGEAVATELRDLAMPGAEFAVDVRPLPDGGGELPEGGLDEVEFLLAANPGEPAQPLSRVASGGELARTMLAARVVLTEGPPTLVFDEVDAGIGGQAGVAVGRRLGLVAREHQVLCVTHLAQVASFADAHIVVSKSGRDGRTEAVVRPVEGAQRVEELSRMLSGHGTDKARRHAEELLASAREGVR